MPNKYLHQYKQLVHLSLPLVLTQAGQISIQLIDDAMVGHFGTVELAAASFANSIHTVIMLFGLGIFLGITPLISHARGAEENADVPVIIKNGFALSLVLLLFITIVSLSLVLAMPHMGQKELVVKLAIPYYYTLVASTIPFLIFVLLKQIGEGLGNTVMAMSATMAANVLHAILNYLLIFGKLGFPRWGLLGAGISTLITRILMPILLYFGLKMIASIRIQLDAARDSKVDLSKIKSIFAVGLPIAIQLILEVASFSFSAVMMGWLGAVSLASHQVAMGLATFTFMIANSIAMAATIRISFHLGNRGFQAVKITSLAAMRLAIAGMGFCGILFILFRHDLPCIFSRDPNVIKQTAILLGIAGLFQIFDGLQIVCLGILRGFSDVKAPMFISGLSYIAIGLPVSYLCAFAFHKGAAGIWYGFFAGLIAAGIMLSWRIRINILALTTPA